jgi:hypothetical protein
LLQKRFSASRRAHQTKSITCGLFSVSKKIAQKGPGCRVEIAFNLRRHLTQGIYFDLKFGPADLAVVELSLNQKQPKLRDIQSADKRLKTQRR